MRFGIVEMPKAKPRILPELLVEGSMRARLIRDVLDQRASERLLGREPELQLLTGYVEGSGAVLAWVHGLPGIGKSALLREFIARTASRGITAIALDCRFIEPSPEGFLFELQRVLKRPVSSIDEAREALSALARPVLVLDSYEVLGLLDGWIRQDFVPGMSELLRVVISSRFAPGPAWRGALEWQDLILTILLSPLSESDSLALLERSGIAASDTTAIYRLTGGHPLALVLAGGVPNTKGRNQDRPDPGALIQQLTRMYLSDIVDPSLRTAIEAASVIRRTTHTLLAALVPDLYRRDLYDELASLSIIEVTNEGLMIHSPVQEAIASWLRSSDPYRFDVYRRAAWQQIRKESAHADRRGLWRYTADLLYLVTHPGLRESFFPTGAQTLSVEQARPADRDAIFAIADGQDAAHEAYLAAWWKGAPEAFRVMRDASGEIAGFYVAADLLSLRGRVPAADPAVKLWLDHLSKHPLSSDETALFLRRWLSKSAGESPSPVQAACWLDVKRSHMALRPRIRRCYGYARDVEIFAPMLHSLGFRVVGDHLLMLEFGPGSFDGWLGDLISQELGLKPEEIVDTATRELVTDGQRIMLTALEFNVLAYLRQREGKAVSRAELLEHVWGQRANFGSNVVDVVVRSLRGKLTNRAWMITTVRGLGYRFRSTRPE